MCNSNNRWGKNELAKKEAVYQIQDQRQQLGDEFKKLREDTAAEKLEELNAKHEDELKKLKDEWEKTTQTIRANAEKEAAAIEARLAALSEAAGKYGVGFMTAYIAGIRSKKSELDSLLEEIKRATEDALGGSGGSNSSTGVGFIPAYQSFAGGGESDQDGGRRGGDSAESDAIHAGGDREPANVRRSGGGRRVCG